MNELNEPGSLHFSLICIVFMCVFFVIYI